MMKQTIQTQHTKRNNGIELYRFIAISLILSSHFIGNSDALKDLGPQIGCGTQMFIFISGWFFVRSTTWRTKKFAVTTLIGTVYGAVIFGVCWGAGLPVDNPFIIFDFKFFGGKYSSGWFLYVYLSFTLLQPFINKFILKFDKWIVFGIILTFALGSVSLEDILARNNPGGYVYTTFGQLFMFTGVYSFGGGFSIYYSTKTREHKTGYRSFIFLLIFAFTFYLCGIRVGLINILIEHNYTPITLTSLFYFLTTITLFYFFYSLPIIKNTPINKIFGALGKYALPLYLMHGIVWVVLDLFYFPDPTIYNINFYVAKFAAYYFTAIAVSIIMYYGIALNEKGFYLIVQKVKNKKTLNKE